MFADVTVLVVTGCTHMRWLVWGDTGTRVNRWKRLSIIQFG